CLTTFYTRTKLKRSSLSPLIRDGIIASLLNSKDVTFSNRGNLPLTTYKFYESVANNY
ncbi:hypothetical protein DL98DRAFT_522701, partial [Cadophora sp. DSE1049]